MAPAHSWTGVSAVPFLHRSLRCLCLSTRLRGLNGSHARYKVKLLGECKSGDLLVRTDRQTIKIWCLALLVVSFSGCATSLKREGQCLASLTPDFLQATQEMARLESDWHLSHLKSKDLFISSSLWLSAESDEPGIPPRPVPSDSDPLKSASTDRYKEAHRAALEARARLLEARLRHQSTVDWYGRVYDRLRRRLEVEQILSEVQFVLLTVPGLIFYPIIRWNIHSVMWDGHDPDADSDSITQYCTDRLSKVTALPEPASVQME